MGMYAAKCMYYHTIEELSYYAVLEKFKRFGFRALARSIIINNIYF